MSRRTWLVLVLLASFNLMSFVSHTVFCWMYDSCAGYPPSIHMLVYAMRMGDFSYGLFCGLCLAARLRKEEECVPSAVPKSEGDAPGASEIVISS